jgi:RimJ/RimL family protein N-acetyltransferase
VIAPTLATDRLTLRAPSRADFEPFAAVLADPERARFMGGPFDRERAWALFAMGIAQWPLAGFGVWTIEERATGTYCGDVGLLHPPHYPELELGWTLARSAEGRGIAFEAATAARAWAWSNLAVASLVSYVAPENRRSVRLAERLGARRDDAAPRQDPGDLVFRHARPA